MGEIERTRVPLDVNRAASYYSRALDQAEHLGMRPLTAHCHLAIGEVYARSRQTNKAVAEISTAMDLYRSMDMNVATCKAEAALKSLSAAQPVPAA